MQSSNKNRLQGLNIKNAVSLELEVNYKQEMSLKRQTASD